MEKETKTLEKISPPSLLIPSGADKNAQTEKKKAGMWKIPNEQSVPPFLKTPFFPPKIFSPGPPKGTPPAEGGAFFFFWGGKRKNHLQPAPPPSPPIGKEKRKRKLHFPPNPKTPPPTPKTQSQKMPALPAQTSSSMFFPSKTSRKKNRPPAGKTWSLYSIPLNPNGLVGAKPGKNFRPGPSKKKKIGFEAVFFPCKSPTPLQWLFRSPPAPLHPVFFLFFPRLRPCFPSFLGSSNGTARTQKTSPLFLAGAVFFFSATPLGCPPQTLGLTAIFFAPPQFPTPQQRPHTPTPLWRPGFKSPLGGPGRPAQKNRRPPAFPGPRFPPFFSPPLRNLWFPPPPPRA